MSVVPLSELGKCMNAAEVQAACAAAIAAAALATQASVDSLANDVADISPDLQTTDVDLLTGALELIVGTAGLTIEVYGLTIKNASGFSAQFNVQSCDIGGANPVSAWGDPLWLNADDSFAYSSDHTPLFVLPVGKSLNVTSPDPWPVKIRYRKV